MLMPIMGSLGISSVKGGKYYHCLVVAHNL